MQWAILEVDGLRFDVSYSIHDESGTIYADAETIDALLSQAGKNAVLKGRNREPIPIYVLGGRPIAEGERPGTAVGFILRD